MASENKIISILNDLRDKRKGQYIQNIIDTALTMFNWSKEETELSLKEAEDLKMIKQTFVNNKISYRIIKDGDVSIRDSVESISIQTEPVCYDNFDSDDSIKADLCSLHNDFMDFKKYVFKELSIIKDRKLLFIATKRPIKLL